MGEYLSLVEQALVEVDEMRQIIEYETEGGPSRLTGLLDTLEAELGRVQDAIRTDTYGFQDQDLSYMSSLAQHSLHTLPFKDLLDLINWTHRTGLATGD
jgi:hypothetical protein